MQAIEAFAEAHGHEHTCVIPAQFLTAVGFKTIHPHPRYPRLRLDLRSVLTWRAEVEIALERLVGAIRPEKKHGPVGVSPRIDPPGAWPVRYPIAWFCVASRPGFACRARQRFACRVALTQQTSPGPGRFAWLTMQVHG